MDRSTSIRTSWEANAANWIETIANNEIESRVLVTNEAIVRAVLAVSPASVLDIGCGEGWLTRLLRSKGIDTYGVDAVASLIRYAIEKDGPYYAVAGFRELADGSVEINRKAAAVINFALLDESDTDMLIKNMHRIVEPGGAVIIQTLHPLVIAMQESYVSGWKHGSWNGMKRDFEQPYQWYFRTMQDWVKIFGEAGLTVRSIGEPLHPSTQKPASLIFTLQLQ